MNTVNTLSPAGFNAVLGQVAVRLADEGIPVMAIARATKVPSDQVREFLEDALAVGTIVEIPRADWAVGVSRGLRMPEPPGRKLQSDDLTIMNVVRAFGVTQQQASLLLVLIKRREVTRKMLHMVIEGRRPHPKVETDQKIVDVVICKLRKKLEGFGLRIDTVWSCGYLMPTEDRKKALDKLNTFLDEPNAIKPEDPVEEDFTG